MQILCHTFPTQLRNQPKSTAKKIALSYRDYDREQWMGISWNLFARRVDQSARSLVALGIGVQDNVAVFSQNKPESLFVEFGCFRSRAALVPFYATTAGAQVQYMVNDAQIRVIFVGEQQQYDTTWSVMSLCHSLEHIVIFDPKVERHPSDNISMSFDEFLRWASTSHATKLRYNVV